jgi:hypothetical protein
VVVRGLVALVTRRGATVWGWGAVMRRRCALVVQRGVVTGWGLVLRWLVVVGMWEGLMITVKVMRGGLTTGRVVVRVWNATVGRWGVVAVGWDISVNRGDVEASRGVVVGIDFTAQRRWVKPVLGGVD